MENAERQCWRRSLKQRRGRRDHDEWNEWNVNIPARKQWQNESHRNWKWFVCGVCDGISLINFRETYPNRRRINNRHSTSIHRLFTYFGLFHLHLRAQGALWAHTPFTERFIGNDEHNDAALAKWKIHLTLIVLSVWFGDAVRFSKYVRRTMACNGLVKLFFSGFIVIKNPKWKQTEKIWWQMHTHTRKHLNIRDGENTRPLPLPPLSNYTRWPSGQGKSKSKWMKNGKKSKFICAECDRFMSLDGRNAGTFWSVACSRQRNLSYSQCN